MAEISARTHASPEHGLRTLAPAGSNIAPNTYSDSQSQWKGRRGKPRCDHCRAHNLKCDRVLPTCNHCAWASRQCRYTPLPTPAHRGIPRCDRCRFHNLKCDRTLPVCNNCKQAEGDCNYTPKKRHKIPTDHILSPSAVAPVPANAYASRGASFVVSEGTPGERYSTGTWIAEHPTGGPKGKLPAGMYELSSDSSDDEYNDVTELDGPPQPVASTSYAPPSTVVAHQPAPATSPHRPHAYHHPDLHARPPPLIHQDVPMRAPQPHRPLTVHREHPLHTPSSYHAPAPYPHLPEAPYVPPPPPDPWLPKWDVIRERHELSKSASPPRQKTPVWAIPAQPPSQIRSSAKASRNKQTDQLNPWYHAHFAPLPRHVLAGIRSVNPLDMPKRQEFDDVFTEFTFDYKYKDDMEVVGFAPGIYTMMAQGLREGHRNGLSHRLVQYMDQHHVQSGSNKYHLLLIPRDEIWSGPREKQEALRQAFCADIDHEPFIHSEFVKSPHDAAAAFYRVPVSAQIFDILVFAHKRHQNAIVTLNEARNTGITGITWAMAEIFCRMCPKCAAKNKS
ncbi:hypothetical protein PENSPDRAFT_688583 [Peniophora sp. CONT]|nr:hypothetical protein PENSPDRAFT_688583 [Peniophora sp. CONT]